MKLCPYCSKDMELAAIVCRRCGRDWKTGVSSRKTAESQDRGSSSPPALTKGGAIAGVYLLVVVAPLLVGFGSSDETLSRYVQPLALYLTMPLSLVGTVLFAWSLIHGGSVGPMVVTLAIAGSALPPSHQVLLPCQRPSAEAGHSMSTRSARSIRVSPDSSALPLGLQQPETRVEATAALRSLIDAITLTPEQARSESN